jgi:uncharacterized phage infection (PIP) family protein YhgE
MDDEAARKTEILQAEEAIRQLAGEMARAASAAAMAEEVRRALGEAVDLLRGTREGLGTAAAEQKALVASARDAIEATRQAGATGLSDAAEQVRAALAGVRDACEQLTAATDQTSRTQTDLTGALDGRLSNLSAAVNAAAERSNQRSAQTAADVALLLEAKLGELTTALQGLSRDVEDAKRTVEIKAHEVLTGLQPRLARQTVLLVLVLIFSIAAALGAGALLWQQYVGMLGK